jgi:ABC-type multidrug transport system ATPase subunit
MNIELRDVCKNFGKFPALHRISLEIAPGQIVALLGSNGAGKTTLLRSLAGIVGLTRGAVLYDGKPFDRGQMDRRKRFFFLPDSPFVLEEWTPLDYLGCVARLYQVEPNGLEEKAMALLRDFDLLPSAEIPFENMSRGHRYKAALVALVAVDPEVWLLDEPFASGVDPHGINALKRHARAAAERGRTIVYSTQILEIAERFSDRVCVIHKGEVRAFESVEELKLDAGFETGVLDEIFDRLREEEAV